MHGASPQSVFERWLVAQAQGGLEPYPVAVYHVRGVPDERTGVVVDTTSVVDRIVRGLMEHRRQRHVIAGGVAGADTWARSVSGC